MSFLRHTLLLVLVLFSPVAVKAQVGEPRSDLAWGVNGGYMMNQVSFNPTIKQTFKGGETFGLTLRYTCEKYFTAICAVQAELNYANLGWKENIEDSEDTYSRDVRYIQLPLLTRMGWGRERRGGQFFFVLGPQFGYMISETEHRSTPWVGRPRPNNVTAQYDLKVQHKFEYGLTGGIGVEISTRLGHFLLEGRYYYGLSDMFDNGKKDPFGRSANGAIVAKASWLFDLIRTPGQIR